METDDLKQVVKEKYGEIAKQSKEQAESSCCGSTSCCSTVDYTVFSENYQDLEGYSADADLGLGCGIDSKEIDEFHNGEVGVFSITVSAYKQ